MYRTSLVFWKYHAGLALTYWVLWALVFGILALLAVYWPQAALWYLRILDPITGAIIKLFWSAFAPEEAKVVVSHLAKWLAPIASKVSGTASEYAPRAVILVRLAFNGFLMVSATAWLLRLPLIPYFRRWLVRALQAK